jgi:hypothetical protein
MEPLHERWDRFIDELDRQGQAGSAADVLVPELGIDMVHGKRFADITRVDVINLSKIATSVGRRGETITTLWDDTQRRIRDAKRPPKAKTSKKTR